MKIRIIELLNHYSEEKNMSDGEALGRFCAFGYHDAIDLNSQNSETEQVSSWDMMERLTVEKLNGKFTMQLLACAYDEMDEKKEREIWEENNRYPFYFLIVMRIENRNEFSCEMMKEINNGEEEVMTYFSFEHCEVMAVCRSGTYKQGIQKLMELKKRFQTKKTYSVFAIEEKLLNNKPFWKLREQKENVNVRLYATIKDITSVEDFLEELRDQLGKKDVPAQFRTYDILGDADLLIEVDHVELNDLLPVYAMGKLLTHTNGLYKKAFYNIESRFLVGDEKNGKSMDNSRNERIEGIV